MVRQNSRAFVPRLSVYFGGIFLVTGIAAPYMPVWFQGKGLSSNEIAMIFGVPLLVRVFFSPLMGMLSDRLENRRTGLYFFSFFALLSTCVLYVVDGFWYYLSIMTVSTVFYSALVPISDAIALLGAKYLGADYGRMRLWGSTAYIGANIGGGFALDAYGFEIILPIFVGANFVVFILSLFVPRDPKGTPSNLRQTSVKSVALSGREQFMPLLRPVFLVMLLAASFIQASHAMVYSFGTLYWQANDIDGSFIGYLWAIGVAVEVALFSVSGKLQQSLGWKNLIYLGGFAAIIRWGLFPVIEGATGLIALQALHGLSFGATHLGTMFFIGSVVPDKSSSTAQTLYLSIGGLVMATGVIISGPLYDSFAGYGFWMMAALAFVGLALLAASGFLAKYPLNST